MGEAARVGKFKIMVYTEDHVPAHVHVWLGKKNDVPSVKVLITADSVEHHSNKGKVSAADEKAAVKAVAENLEACLAKWREIYG